MEHTLALQGAQHAIDIHALHGLHLGVGARRGVKRRERERGAEDLVSED